MISDVCDLSGQNVIVKFVLWVCDLSGQNVIVKFVLWVSLCQLVKRKYVKATNVWEYCSFQFTVLWEEQLPAKFSLLSTERISS